MPLEHEIHHDRRLVVARGQGVFTDQDVFGYQLAVWSWPDVAGYDELVDMSAVERIDLPSPERVRELAAISAGMDVPSGSSRFVIVAPQDIAYALGRMYETHRGLQAGSTKKVEVFRSLAEALEFLGIESLA